MRSTELKDSHAIQSTIRCLEIGTQEHFDILYTYNSLQYPVHTILIPTQTRKNKGIVDCEYIGAS